MEYPLLLEMSQMLASRVFLVSFDFHCCTTGNSYSYVSTVTSTPPVLEVMDMFTCVDYEFFTVVFPKRYSKSNYYEATGHIENFKLKAVIL